MDAIADQHQSISVKQSCDCVCLMNISQELTSRPCIILNHEQVEKLPHLKPREIFPTPGGHREKALSGSLPAPLTRTALQTAELKQQLSRGALPSESSCVCHVLLSRWRTKAWKNRDCLDQREKCVGHQDKRVSTICRVDHCLAPSRFSSRGPSSPSDASRSDPQFPGGPVQKKLPPPAALLPSRSQSQAGRREMHPQRRPDLAPPSEIAASPASPPPPVLPAVAPADLVWM